MVPTEEPHLPPVVIIFPSFLGLGVSHPAFLSFHFLFSLYPPLLGIHACAAINTLSHKAHLESENQIPNLCSNGS